MESHRGSGFKSYFGISTQGALPTPAVKSSKGENAAIPADAVRMSIICAAHG